MNKALVSICILLTVSGMAGLGAKMFLSTLTKPPAPGAKGPAAPNLKAFEAAVKELKNLESSELRLSIVNIKAGQIEAYAQEIESLLKECQLRNDNLNSPFKGLEAKTPLKRPGGETLMIPDPPEFSIRYLDEIQKLSADFRGICPVMGADVNDKVRVSSSLPTQYSQKWNSSAPSGEDVPPAMREYNILLSLYEVLRDSGVHALDKISISDAGASTGPKPQGAALKTAAFYQGIPVEIKCRLAGSQIPVVLSRILANSKLIYQIREVEAEALSPTDPATKAIKNGFTLNLTLHLLEFSTKNHEAACKALRDKVLALRESP